MTLFLARESFPCGIELTNQAINDRINSLRFLPIAFGFRFCCSLPTRQNRLTLSTSFGSRNPLRFRVA